MLEFIQGLLGTLLYPLFSIIFVCIDGVQSLFYAFAGIGDIKVVSSNIWSSGIDTIGSGNTGAENDTGIVYYFFNNALVKNMLLSIMLLALFLVIIFTVMAFIKNAYAAKQKGWKEIVGNAIKGLANFIFVPICCLLGVWLGNILLDAINGATSSGGTTNMSRKLFIASAYNSNDFRAGKKDSSDWEDLKSFAVSCGYAQAEKITSGLSNEQYAVIVDEIYATTDVSISFQGSVGKWYQVWSINYLVMIVGGIFMLYVLGSLSFAMVRRMFMLIILFIISPGVCSMYPLDEGKAVGSWKGEFTKLVLSAYGAVAGMNIFFSIMPLVDQISFYGTSGDISGLNTILQLFIMVVGLLCVKEVISLISGFVGGEDAFAKGSGLMKQSVDAVKKYGAKAASVSSRFAGHAFSIGKKVAPSLFKIGKGAVGGVGTMGGAVGRRIANGKLGQAIGRRVEARKTKKVQDYAVSKGWATVDENGQVTYKRFYSQGRAEREMSSELDAAREAKIKNRRAKLNGIATGVKDQFAAFGNTSFGLAVGHAGAKIASAGRAIKNSEFGQAVGDALKNLPGGLKTVSSAIYHDSGMAEWLANNIAAPYQKSANYYSKGVVGEGKARKNLENVRVEAMSTEVLNALGDFSKPAFDNLKKMFFKNAKGKMVSFKEALNLSKSSTIEDMRDIDSVLSRLASFESRLNNPNLSDDAKASILEEAVKFARETDSNGNERLQEALDSALGNFLDAQKNGTPVNLDGATKEMIEASKAAAKAMADDFNKNTSKMVKEVLDEKRKNK